RVDGAVDARPVLGPLAEVATRWRNLGLAVVLVAWGLSIASLAGFMIEVLAPVAEGGERPSARAFMASRGPWIVAGTVILPSLVAALLDRLRRLAPRVPSAATSTRLQRILDPLAGAILGPLAELVGRLGFASVLVLLLILSYRLTDSIWGPFAFPFYLGELHYSNDEVAFASKIFGVGMTIAGVALAGGCLLRFGRMATLTLGAVVAAASNLLYFDLAVGAPRIDEFLSLSGLGSLLAAFGIDARMARLLVAISGENIAGGFAGAAFVAYLSSIASREYSAVQYALLSSLTLLVGSLGRGPLGEAIDTGGYAPVFLFTAALGGVGVVACLLEWARQRLSGDGAPVASRYAPGP
ncbi:partial Anhydromuropeptide permease, partial [Myxococcaceae bacterium]